MSKNFYKDGKWIDNPHETKVLKCECGEKYIKTRVDQTRCLRCTARLK